MDTLKEVWKSLTERFTNPLLYSFAISWLLINYKVSIVLLSDANYIEKVNFIDTYIHPPKDSNLFLLAYAPALSAAVYVFFLPIISLLSTFATATYERWHSDIRSSQSRKAILTKEQRERLEQEVSELNNRIRQEAQEAEAKQNEAEANMRLHVAEVNSLINTIWFEHLKTIAASWQNQSIFPPSDREIRGSKEQQDFVKTYGIPQTWAKVFEVLKMPEGIRPDELEGPLNINRNESLEMLISLSALNMLTPAWHNGALHFKLIESSWVALLNGRPA